MTGCDSGFGRDVVDKILACRIEFFSGVFACYHREGEHEESDSLVPIVVDITCDDSVASMAKIVGEVLKVRGGQLVAVVNNAGGLCVAGPIEWGTIEKDIDQMNLNFFGSVRVTRALLPFLRAAALTCTPRLIFTSSLMGVVAAPFGASYAASKFALEGWCDALRREMLSFGISVHLIEPGVFMGTKFYDQYESLVGEPVDGYGQAYHKYAVQRLVRLRTSFASINSRLSVSDTIIKALTSRWPKHRYRVGYDAKFVGWLFWWLPTSLSDLAITVCDALLFMDRKMTPVLPDTSRFTNGMAMVSFAVAGYMQTGLCAFVFILLYLVIV